MDPLTAALLATRLISSMGSTSSEEEGPSATAEASEAVAPTTSPSLEADLESLYGSDETAVSVPEPEAAHGTAAADIGAKQAAPTIESTLEQGQASMTDAGAAQVSDAQQSGEAAMTPVDVASTNPTFKSAQLRRRYNQLMGVSK